LGEVAIREKLISELYQDVYGPRLGSKETMDGDPQREYITGVIIPSTCRGIVDTPDNEVDVRLDEGAAPTDESLDDIVPTKNIDFATPSELNPKMRPKSFGISFIVTGGNPSFKICVTWGRYTKVDLKWKREPFYKIVEVSQENYNTPIPIYNGDDGKILLSIKRILENDDLNTIIISVINNLLIDNCYGDELTSASIFQPAIRVKLMNDTKLHPFKPKVNNILDFIYRDQPVIARGYMCAAIWGDIEYIDNVDSSVIWPDGLYYPECMEFIKSDVRSEFVPLCPSPSPCFDWDKTYGKSPVFSAKQLSEMWSNEDVDVNLLPLVESYEKWIGELAYKLDNLSIDGNNFTSELLKAHTETASRIRAGISTLKTDVDAKLSFCFANRTIWQQNRWKNNEEDFSWRPFQLAFILMNIEPLCYFNSPYREKLDLLWIPTGGGKTESYLALMAFTMAIRRRRAISGGVTNTGAGTAILSRYTLRLLTIQQFRRTLGMVTAAEYLRVSQNKNGFGWVPEKSNLTGKFVYGSSRFSIGMWVGGAVTPNHLRRGEGAIDALMGNKSEGEPAQIVKCPVCSAWLTIPHAGLPAGENKLDVIVKYRGNINTIQTAIKSEASKLNGVKEITIDCKGLRSGYCTISLLLKTKKLTEHDIDEIFGRIKGIIDIDVASFRASRPGYFGIDPEPGRRNKVPRDFEIYCPNPSCDLNNNVTYTEGVPINSVKGGEKFPDGLVDRIVDLPFLPHKRVPIPAYTVDEQVYCKCPTIIICTADKIARLAFEPRAASIFGNVDRYNSYYGYCRETLSPENVSKSAWERPEYNTSIIRFNPPDMIVQDELHLIEGPLGSMYGLYEIAVDGLILGSGGKPKYIASTATITNAGSQVLQLYARDLFQFPPYGYSVNDNFFVRIPDKNDAWNENGPGRVYMGIYAPGMGPLTPNIRIWSRLLKTNFDNSSDRSALFYWTIVGYYNALRELGGGRALYREDIVEWLNYISKLSENQRVIDQEKVVELSSRINSTDIPQLLSDLEDGIKRPVSENADAIFTTSMFGTGVDIPHLSLMVVNGQPKTTSQYIQTTGRVGRKHGGLIVTFLRAGRPRDLSHYEMFPAYHNRLYLEVEPSSVSPFSDGAMNRVSGPAMISFLRNMVDPSVDWFEKNGSVILNNGSNIDIDQFINLLSRRFQKISVEQEEINRVLKYFLSQKDRWVSISKCSTVDNIQLDFVEYILFQKPSKSVVLGDPYHENFGKINHKIKTVFKNAPQSLREIEETTGFEV